MLDLLKQKYRENTFCIKDIVEIIIRVYHAYFNKELQQTACALTHRTLLALVPLLAMMFAIARGFNMHDFLLEHLCDRFQNQKDAINYAASFVDTYLKHTTDSVFIGVGIVVLLTTLYFLLNAVEHSFNKIWDCKERTYTRKFSDYTSILFWIPVLTVVASGISVWVNSGIRSFFELPNIPSTLKIILTVTNFFIGWIVFTLVMKYVPNTEVRLRFAIHSGFICSIGFEVLQSIFEFSIYVSSYHAVYGSFAYLPLFLLWMQFSWLICLVGAQIASASQKHYEAKRGINNCKNPN